LNIERCVLDISLTQVVNKGVLLLSFAILAFNKFFQQEMIEAVMNGAKEMRLASSLRLCAKALRKRMFCILKKSRNRLIASGAVFH
jgi:hypothetical protein